MLSIARHTDYAARIVLHLAALGDDARVGISEIARIRRMPAPFVRRLAGKLVRAKILATVRGNGGGVRLARPASELSLLEVVEAMEGPVVLNRCVQGGEGCPLAGHCPIHCVWSAATRELKASLAAARFDALARTPEHLKAHLALRQAPARTPSRSK